MEMTDTSVPWGTEVSVISWIDRYATSRLALKRETTRSTYTLILRQFLI